MPSDSTAQPTRLIAIGASTGGPQAIEFLLQQMDTSLPPVLLVQHMPAVFTRAFARRLDEQGKIRVKEAEDGDTLQTGRMLIAPGGLQMRLVRRDTGLVVHVADGPAVNRHKPSVDALFDSLVTALPEYALGILLTGMGNDGAQGLRRMRECGYATLAQDEASSTVWGMPREAVRLGAVAETDVLPLSSIPAAIRNFALRKG